MNKKRFLLADLFLVILLVSIFFYACGKTETLEHYNNDGIVGIDDLLILLSQWGNPYNTNDLLFMLADYGQTCN